MISEASIEFYRTKDGQELGQLICPVCGKETGVRVRRDSVVERLPLRCSRYCKALTVISYKNGKEIKV